MGITVTGIDSVIQKLEALDFERKAKQIAKELADIGWEVAAINYLKAWYAGDNDVDVNIEPSGNGYALVASGTSVLFIEFGSGVYQPAYPTELPPEILPRGTYGKGKGKNLRWVYEGEQGNLGKPVVDKKTGKAKEGVYWSYGNTPARAMYDADKQMREKIPEIVKRVMFE